MTDREFIQWTRDECDTQLGAAIPPPISDTASPTGRNPRLVWTPALQDIYNRMIAEREAGEDTLGAAWAKVILDNAKGNIYGDYGLWGTIAYQMTGDVEFLERAWTKLTPMLASNFEDDDTNREYSAERVLQLDWLWPGLTEARRTEYLAAMDRMCNAMIVEETVRTNDSDQATGCYFGVTFYNLAFGDIHPPAAEFFAHPQVGGLDATGRNRATLRNSILDYVGMASGGEWIESQEYNLGTVRLLLMGAAGVRTATGVDHFPEVTAWLSSHALKYPLMTAPGLGASHQWGDEQHPHTFEPWRWVSTAMCVNHPVARQYVYDLVAKYGPSGDNTAEPTIPKAFLLFDPYGEKAGTTETLFDARGQGILSARSPAGSLLCTHLPPVYAVGGVDHGVGYFGDVRLYRSGGWALTHPLTYGGVGLDGRGCNVMLHRGMGTAKEWRGSQAVYAGSDWVFTACTSGGTILAPKFYQPPPTWLHEYSRSLLWIYGADVDTLVVFDRTHCDDPLTLPGFTKYNDSAESRMQSHPLRLWRWHMPVAPVIAGPQAHWPIGEGEQACLTWLRNDLNPVITDQVTAWPTPPYSMKPTEKKFHLDLVAEDVIGFQTLITVVECGNPSAFSVITDHNDDAQHVQAVTLTRTGRPTWEVWFNSMPGPTLPTYGGNSAYHPEIPGLLAPLRFRDYANRPTGTRIWGMETENSLPVTEAGKKGSPRPPRR